MLLAVLLVVQLSTTCEGKKKSKKKKATTTVAAEERPTEWSITSVEYCESCAIVVEAYASELKRIVVGKHNDLTRGGEGKVDGSKIAEELCDKLNATHSDWVYIGCMKLKQDHFSQVFKPFAGSMVGGLTMGAGLPHSAVIDKKREICTSIEACPQVSRSLRPEYPDDDCSACGVLAHEAESLTERTRIPPETSAREHNLNQLEHNLCPYLAQKFTSPSRLEDLCETILDDHLEAWAAILALRRRIRRQLGAKPSESLVAKLCGAEGARICTAPPAEL